MLKVKFLTSTARNREIKRATDGSAGYDLYADESHYFSIGERKIVKTGISIGLSTQHIESFYEFYGRIAPRSGMTLRGFDVGAGVIDSDYTGEIGVILINNSGKEQYINQGDRIAQLILEVIMTPPVIIVDSITETKRGGAGFGSTGK